MVRKGARYIHSTPEDIERRRRRVRGMAKAGLVDHEIAGELGVSERTILRDRKAANIPTGYDPFMRMPRLKSKDGRRAS